MFQEIIVLTIAYIVLVGLFNCPKKTTSPQSVAPQSVAPQSVAPQTVAPQTVAPQSVAPQTVAPQTVAPQTVAPHSKKELSSLGIRELKKLASKAKIYRYSTMKKSELVKALAF
jgi:hypothetical protein